MVTKEARSKERERTVPGSTWGSSCFQQGSCCMHAWFAGSNEGSSLGVPLIAAERASADD